MLSLDQRQTQRHCSGDFGPCLLRSDVLKCKAQEYQTMSARPVVTQTRRHETKASSNLPRLCPTSSSRPQGPTPANVIEQKAKQQEPRRSSRYKHRQACTCTCITLAPSGFLAVSCRYRRCMNSIIESSSCLRRLLCAVR